MATHNMQCVCVCVCVCSCYYIHILLYVLYYDNASTAALEPRSPYQRATRKTLLESLTRPKPPALPYASMPRITQSIVMLIIMVTIYKLL